MRSLLGPLLNKAPAYVGSGRVSIPWTHRNDAEAQMAAMGSVGTLFAIVDLLSTSVASLEWNLYRKAQPGQENAEREQVFTHPALDLWNKPNPFMARQQFVAAVEQHVDLTGEGWALVARNPKVKRLPLELWPMRPDKMDVVTSSTDFLLGYVHTDPDGRKTAIGLGQALRLTMPNPLDPYRGLGPVQPLLTDLDSAKYSAEWNRNFFKNSAEPGGIIEVEKRLSDDEFDEMTDRWNEQHRGVANAHRVAVIEQGKWVTRTFSMRDMQFTELRHLSRDVIMEAYRIHPSMLGIVQDVNRANAVVAERSYAKNLVVPRADRWKGMLNTGLLPLYGTSGEGLEFDYVSPVPEDEEAENAARASKTTGFKALVESGVDPQSAAEVVGLPPMRMRVLTTTPAAPAARRALPAAHATLRLRNADEPPADPDAVEQVDLEPVQEDWLLVLAVLLAIWAPIVAAWIAALLDQIRALLDGGDATKLAKLDVDFTDAADALHDAFTDLAARAADRVVEEAAAQGVTVTPEVPDDAELHSVARMIAALEGERYALAAGRETARVTNPDTSDDEVIDLVRDHLEALPESATRAALGGALTGAQNAARKTTLLSAPVGAIYASEVLDASTCLPCSEVHGRWICNTDDLTPLNKLYPSGGYINCKGGIRCRGTFVGVWRPQTTKGGA